MSDIRIYNFEFELMGILPEEQCSSINYKKEFNGIGSFEIDFCSDRIADLIEENIDVLFLEYEDFQGYFTGYLYKENSNYKVFGKSLNGLLHKRVIPAYNNDEGTSEYVSNLVRYFVNTYYDFLEVADQSYGLDEIVYKLSKDTYGDSVVSDLLSGTEIGYQITADIKNKKYVFELLGRNEKGLVLSEQNLNAYEFEISYDNKEKANYGYYMYQYHITSGSIGYKKGYIYGDGYNGGGIYGSEASLEYKEELKKKKGIHNINCKTNRIQFGKDYNLGDIVTIQHKNVTVKKVVTAVTVSKEADRKEIPTFTEV